jgi:hypothetical protein
MGLWAYDVFMEDNDKWFWVTGPEEFPNGALAASPEGAIEEAGVQRAENVRVIRRVHRVIKFSDGKRDE